MVLALVAQVPLEEVKVVDSVEGPAPKMKVLGHTEQWGVHSACFHRKLLPFACVENPL